MRNKPPGWKAGTRCTVAPESAVARGLRVVVLKDTSAYKQLIAVVGPFGRRYEIPPDFLIPDDPAQRPTLITDPCFYAGANKREKAKT